MVLQDPWLFAGTIRENIRYGRESATDEEILEAAKATSSTASCTRCPTGTTPCSTRTRRTSRAGEKQLITIARAFVAQPSVLILDEATSSVDTRTELLLQHAMAALREGRTSFVIAHRLSTIRDADLILVMEHGDIVEKGSHEELIARAGRVLAPVPVAVRAGRDRPRRGGRTRAARGGARRRGIRGRIRGEGRRGRGGGRPLATASPSPAHARERIE